LGTNEKAGIGEVVYDYDGGGGGNGQALGLISGTLPEAFCGLLAVWRLRWVGVRRDPGRRVPGSGPDTRSGILGCVGFRAWFMLFVAFLEIPQYPHIP
jgi:hypothetical protein